MNLRIWLENFAVPTTNSNSFGESKKPFEMMNNCEWNEWLQLAKKSRELFNANPVCFLLILEYEERLEI
jgi:hypothetical protein